VTALTRNVAVYVVGTGEILKTLGGAPSFIAQNTPEGCAVIDAPFGTAEHLIMVDETASPPVLAPRPVLPVVLPAAVELGAVLHLAVPAGVCVRVDGEDIGEADEEGLEIAFASPGRFLVEVHGFPYAPIRQRITVD
jgi:hypothetical protein